MAKNTYQFKAEVRQLLDILVHSLYTHKEIFLRELISNASDALDKYRHESQLTAEQADADTDLEIRVNADKDAGTLTVADTGIGMTREELMQNIGTIAHSGSATFMGKLAESTDKSEAALDNLIGRFGVGFYSVYMVAEEVVVTTKSASDEPAQVWSSDGKGSYKIVDGPEDTPRGTTIEVHLKDEFKDEFADPETLKTIIRKHSNFISHPIFVGEDRVNTVPAIWREPKFQVTTEQYNEFYQFLTYDAGDPLHHLHTSVDAPVQYNALLFVPPHTDHMFGMGRDDWGLDLYVRRVLIERQNKDLLPEYLGFVKGVVDTEDLPLNISRETLQDNLLIKKIGANLTKQVLGELKKLKADDRDKYHQFWDAHEETFKGGYMDFLNKDTFAELLLFNSSSKDEATELTDLDGYVERAKEGQKEIYYLFGPSREACNLSPHVEQFKQKGIEVLYLYQPVDEFIMDTVREYRECKLVSAEHAAADALDAFEAVEEKKVEELADDDKATFNKLLKAIKTELGDKVTEVKASKRLADSPVCLANPDGRVTSSMDKIMRVMSKDTSIPQKVLEVNPNHPLVRNLIKVFEKDAADPFIGQSATQLYEAALLLEGYLTDPHALVGRIQDLLTQASGWYLK